MRQRLVDNRVFLLGLDALYRGAMKRNEGFELLRCAREVAWTLHIKPAYVPVEGYYAEDQHLTAFFRLLRALQNLAPRWTIPTLTPAAEQAARDMDDYSLVGLAARTQDPVVLAALRESVVLYAQVMMLGMALEEPPIIEWRVDKDLTSQANRFIGAFHALFPQGRRLPAATAENAATYL